eukprot:TRINITY_DN4485_c0_g1_i3.p1 TRINITY_DN4485_c0_g1~~TRINITY_DN4485_c0_g1_i3.p1  ORF type:complete len:498 (+),score=60.37 TRINITY_DN4485_c0_g1_i3:554-2047(+)
MHENQEGERDKDYEDWSPGEFNPYTVKIPNVVVVPPKNEDKDTKMKREAIRNAFIHAYGGYEKKCMGAGEVKPVSGQCNDWLVKGMGLSIMDSLDTMLIMGLDKQYRRGRDYLAEHLDWNTTINVSVFETNIRCLGGLLSSYAFTKDPLLLRKATELAKALLPAFDTPTGFPYTWVVLGTNKTSLSQWTHGSVILSELGTMQLEFLYLSHLTGDPIYGETAIRAYETLYKNKPSSTLYPLMTDIMTGRYTTDTLGIGALADSFYEYILKVWLLSGSSNAFGDWYFEEAEAIIDKLGVWIDAETLLIGEILSDNLRPKMDHLACFSGAMFALGSRYTPDRKVAENHMKYATGIANFCRKMYEMTPSGLPCDSVKYNKHKGTLEPAEEENWCYYQMRPEAVETWFYMWRLTNDSKYRDWGWEFFLSIEKHTRARLGYTGIRDASLQPEDLEPDDIQQSYFLAETLKYLYLLFSPSEFLSLNQFVFNTEAHPFPLPMKRI